MLRLCLEAMDLVLEGGGPADGRSPWHRPSRRLGTSIHDRRLVAPSKDLQWPKCRTLFDVESVGRN